MIPITWLSYHDNVPAKYYWDQGLLIAAFEGRLWKPAKGYSFTDCFSIDEAIEKGNGGSIVVLPAAAHKDDIERLNADLQRLSWCLLLLTEDECSQFDFKKVDHPNIRIWVMNPYPGWHEGLGKLTNGWTPKTPELAKKMKAEYDEKPLDWFFTGQMNHGRRHKARKMLKDIPNGEIYVNESFGGGRLSDEEYMRLMAKAKIVPCPAGNTSPDSFRFHEALEVGAIPIADNKPANPTRTGGYWRYVFGDNLPFPIIENWKELPGIYDEALKNWQVTANKCFAWWQSQKRDLVYRIHETVLELSDTKTTVNSEITVLMPSSPIPSHPSTAVIDETIASVRERLPEAEIIIMIDGVRGQQKDRAEAYETYKRELLWKCNHEWTNVLPLVFEEFTHQASMTRKALELVKTDTILFVEHDCPLVGDIPFSALVSELRASLPLDRRSVNMIRLHHEQQIHPEHQHLMHGALANTETPLTHTTQWSQRPHLARTDFYRGIISNYFGVKAKTMIEDPMHGVVQNLWPAKDFGIYIYTPEGNIQRSRTVDGRKDDPKYPMIFQYDGEVPDGAPQPSKDFDHLL